MPLMDSFGRTIKQLRVSLTDKCDMRCVYCSPAEGIRSCRNDELLTLDEIARVIRISVSLGIRKIRFTGGEPLLRPGLPDLVRRVAAMEGINDIGLTTNGTNLKEMAAPLYEAGLRRVNVSLDSLDPDRFRSITRRNALHRIMEGLSETERVGYRPIKINVVALRGFTEPELIRFAALARCKPYQVRFIEFMPMNAGSAWSRDAVLSGQEIRACVNDRWPLEPVSPDDGGAPASVFRFADGKGEIGIIATVTEPFCHRCDRIRLTADGKIRACLFSLRETDLREALRRGASDARLAEAIADTVACKENGHAIGRLDFQKPCRSMSAVGG